MIRLVISLADAAVITLFVAAIPARYRELATLCARSCAVSQVSTSMGAPKLPLNTYATILIVLEGTFALPHLLAALGIFWRRASHPMAFFVASMLMMWGTTFPSTMVALAAADPAWTWPVAAARFLGAATLTLFFYIFPDGHFRPRWAVWLAVPWIISQVPRYFAPQSPLNPDTWSPLLLALVSSGFLGVMIALQVYRYRWVSDPAQQRQTKWVTLGIGAALMGYAALLMLRAFSPTLAQPGTPGYLAVLAAEEACVALLPLSITVAIVRDRLFDVDRLINRTLVYGTLTAILALVYVGGVISIQTVMSRLIHGSVEEQSPLIIVLTTLLIVALFRPLRRHLQALIDRRFFRRKYDAARTLARFAEALRSQAELETLTDDLMAVVNETMQPTHVSLWLDPHISNRSRVEMSRHAREDAG